MLYMITWCRCFIKYGTFLNIQLVLSCDYKRHEFCNLSTKSIVCKRMKFSETFGIALFYLIYRFISCVT